MAELKTEHLEMNNSIGLDTGKNLHEIKINKRKSKKESNKEENKFSLYQKFMAELIGSTILVYNSCGSAVFQKDKLYAPVLSSAFCVTFLVYCFFNISGAHFNPCVSLPIYLKGSLKLKEFIFYIIAQIFGAFIGCCFIALSNIGRFKELNATKIQDYLIQVNGGMNIDVWCYISCLFTETFATFMLILFVMAIGEKVNKLEPILGLAFGCLLISLIFTGCNISGSSFNPTRSLAPAVLQALAGGDKRPLEQIWIYLIGPTIGSILAFYAWKIFKT